MREVIVGVILTAVLGGLLIPLVKGSIDRSRERFVRTRTAGRSRGA